MQIKLTILPLVWLSLAPILTAQHQQHSETPTPAASQMPVPDLLKEAAAHPRLRLEQFQQFALAANPTLSQANAIVRRSGAQARQAGLYPNPSVGYQGEQIRGGAFHGGEQGAFVQQTFVLGGKLGLRRNVYEQQRRGDQIGVEEQRFRVLSDVGQSFYAALAAQDIVSVREKLLALATDAVVTAHQLANVGQADAPDVLQAEVEAEQAKVDYTTAQRDYIRAFQSLAALVGKPELELSRLEGKLDEPPRVNPNTVVKQIVEESPSVKRARQELVRAEAEIKSAKRESVPDLVVRGGVQQNFAPINETTGVRTGFQAFASAGITLPIFNRNQGNVAAADAELERARGELSRIQLSTRQSAQSLLQEYLSSEMEARRYKNDMIPRAAQAYQLYMSKYHQMGAAYPQVLISQRTYFQLQIGYVNALRRLWETAVALENYALSAGLSSPEVSGITSNTINAPNAPGGVQ